MSVLHLEPWLTLGLTLLSLALLLQLGHFPGWRPTLPPTQHRSPRPLRPRTPDDCPFCRESGESPASSKTVIPYAQRKSPRGCKTRSASIPRATPVPIRIAPISRSPMRPFMPSSATATTLSFALRATAGRAAVGTCPFGISSARPGNAHLPWRCTLSAACGGGGVQDAPARWLGNSPSAGTPPYTG